ncbi:MAG: hypothetical protein MUO81_05445 [Thermoplasmata archaeon]|nr:hypothetical protein [Thermoplasmata archaeon]
MKLESKLAERVVSKKASRNLRKTYASLVGIVFIVLTLTSSTTAVPQSVIHVGTNDSVAKYLGPFEGKSNVIMVGVSSIDDWVCIKVPFKGKISDLKSISFSEFVALTGDAQLEPYVVLKLPEGKSLVCHPESSYSGGAWSLQTFTWQSRDAVTQGKWVVAPVKTESMLAPLTMWMTMIGDRSVISVSIYVGGWDISGQYQCYLGDFSINGVMIDFANMARKS